MEFPSKYNFKEKEQQWQNYWLDKKIYSWRDDQPRSNTYVVDTPPPTVSGQLHIGHVYSYTQTDFIVRYKRMKGMDIFYPMGFDDNGLPTERLVEKKKKLKAASMDRAEFIEVCKEVVLSEEEKFRQLFNSIALSVDWDQEYQTISPVSQKISQLSFLELVNKGQVYRNAQPILWDPVDQTALAQADIEDKERSSFMNDIEFTTDSSEKVMIATTRPELLPACVAVFFHPDDDRYKHLIGRYAITPLFNVKVPILADDLVNPEKGTGLVMCCTFGDQTDILWWRKHNLPCKIILNKYGKIDNISFDNACLDVAKADSYATEIKGLKVQDARSKILELLRDNDSLIKQTEISQTVKCAERSGAPLEIITTPQWFIKTIDHKDALKKRSSELIWHPESMKIKLDTWIDSISWDWCISRQRFFGVPFPVWYSRKEGEEGKPIFAKPEQLPVDPMSSTPDGYQPHEVVADMDVMDTWSTSSVSPQLNSHGIAEGFMANHERHSKLFPADLRPQGHEIIRTWAFYTMLKAHLHEGTLPWSNIMVSGWCLAEDRSKMSKSKGNVIIPEILLEQFGSDVVRYWSSSSRLGADTVYSEDVLKNGKRLVNKLWNAAKFVSTHFPKLEDKYKQSDLATIEHEICCDYDKYFLNKLQQIIELVTADYERYEYALAMLKLENFFWKEFCDNYLEITKSRAYNENGNDNAGQKSALITLYHSLEILLRLFAPVMPHITEELYQILYATKQSIHERGNWPSLKLSKLDDNIASQAGLLVEVLELVRKAKASANLSIKAPIEIIEIQASGKFTNNLVDDLKDVTSAETIAFTDALSTDTPIEGNKVSIHVVYPES